MDTKQYILKVQMGREKEEEEKHMEIEFSAILKEIKFLQDSVSYNPVPYEM